MCLEMSLYQPFWLAGQFGWGGAFAALAIGPALGCLAMARLLPARG